MDLKDKNTLSDHLTHQAFKEGTQDIKQEQFEDAERLQLATIEPLWDYWNYLRLIYNVVKVSRFMPIFIFSNRSSAARCKI